MSHMIIYFHTGPNIAASLEAQIILYQFHKKNGL